MFPCGLLVLILHLHHDDAYFLVGFVGLYLRDVPVAREEYEEFVRSRVDEEGLVHFVIVVDDVGTIGALGRLVTWSSSPKRSLPFTTYWKSTY